MNRKSFLKGSALFAAIPLMDTLTMRGMLLADGNITKYSTNLVQNGEVITGAHWGDQLLLLI